MVCHDLRGLSFLGCFLFSSPVEYVLRQHIDAPGHDSFGGEIPLDHGPLESRSLQGMPRIRTTPGKVLENRRHQ